MKKLLELIGKAKKYLGIAMRFLMKLVGFGKKAEKILDEAEDQVEKEMEKKD